MKEITPRSYQEQLAYLVAAGVADRFVESAKREFAVELAAEREQTPARPHSLVKR